MSLAKGFFTSPITLDDDSAHIRVTYTDVTTQDVTIPAGTYYPQGDGGATDLLLALETALNTDATNGANWTVSQKTTGLYGRVTMDSDESGGKLVDTFTFLRSQLTSTDLGYANATITFLLAVATATHRLARTWHPEEETFVDESDDAPTTVQALTASKGVTDIYDAPGTRDLFWPQVFAALVLTQYTSEADHVGNVSSLASGDPNASLQAWLAQVRAECGGDTPRVRWTPDRASPGAYSEAFLPDDAYSVKGWVESKNETPLFYTLAITLLTPTS